MQVRRLVVQLPQGLATCLENEALHAERTKSEIVRELLRREFQPTALRETEGDRR